MADFSRRGVLAALAVCASMVIPEQGIARSKTMSDPPIVEPDFSEQIADASKKVKLPTADPNFFLSMTDDSDNRMPRELFVNQKTRVADKGAHFTQCHVPFSKCEESRATFLLGKVYHNHGVKGYADMKPKELQTLAKAMQAKGYYTIFVGKMMTDFGQILDAQGDLTHRPPGWSYIAAKCEITGPFRYYNAHYSVNGVIRRFKDEYATDVETSLALEGLALAAASGKPVFLVVCWTSCHGNGFGGLDDSPEPRLDNQTGWFDDAVYPHQRNWGSAGSNKKPAWQRRLTPVDPEKMNILHRNRLRCTATNDRYRGTVDNCLGEILDFFDTNGWTPNTYVACTDDNGYMMGEFNYVGKIKGYRESTGVPFDMCGPGIDPFQTIDAPIQTTDWVATVAELAGVTAPLQPDGKSLKALFRGTVPAWWRTAMFVETEQFKGIHTKDWTYIVTDDEDGHYVELYDISRDPVENWNRFDNSSYFSAMTQLDEVLGQLTTGAGPTMWYARDLPPPPE